MTEKKNILLWALALIICAIFTLELWARAGFATLAPPPYPEVLALPSELLQADPLLGSHFVPNASKFFESNHNEFKVNYQINEIGLRDSGMLAAGTKQPNVLVLGDCAVEGWGVMPEATFVLEMQRRLRFQKDAEIFPRILNAGMTGFGAVQSYLLGKKLIGELNPKVIIFSYSSLMPVADHQFLKHAKLDNEGLAERAGSKHSFAPENTEAKRSWLDGLTLYRLFRAHQDARDARARVKLGNPSSDIFAATRGSIDNMKNLHAISLKHVAALAKIARRNNIKFILLHMPLPHQVAADEYAEGRVGHQLEARIYETPDEALLRQLCENEKIECALPLDMFRKLAQERSSRIFFRYDYTLTAVGHNAMIDFLIGKVRASLNIETPAE